MVPLSSSRSSRSSGAAGCLQATKFDVCLTAPPLPRPRVGRAALWGLQRAGRPDTRSRGARVSEQQWQQWRVRVCCSASIQLKPLDARAPPLPQHASAAADHEHAAEQSMQQALSGMGRVWAVRRAQAGHWREGVGQRFWDSAAGGGAGLSVPGALSHARPAPKQQLRAWRPPNRGIPCLCRCPCGPSHAKAVAPARGSGPAAAATRRRCQEPLSGPQRPPQAAPRPLPLQDAC